MENLKLLIIEDDSDQRELIRETLEDHFGRGTVTGCESRRAALAEKLEDFDLILSDYNLPDGSGMDLLDQIKGRCSTPVILVTGENVGNTAVEAIRKGATDYVVKVGDYLFTIPLVVEKNLTVAKVRRENEQLRVELEKALAEVRDKNLQLEKSLQRVEEVAATDPLTGLYNRRHFGKVLEQLFAEAQRYDKDLSCVMIDLDGYKQLNDAFGHQLGDQILIIAGKVISANLRKMDVAARYGGDEFILLLPHAAAEEAAGVATRIRDQFRQASTVALHRNEGVTMSIGIGSIQGMAFGAAGARAGEPAGPEQLIGRADNALYRSKEDGRNRITISSSMPASAA